MFRTHIWSIAILMMTTASCGRREIIVDPAGVGDFTSISEAVEAAGPGDVVTVRAGIYRETVRVDGKGGALSRRLLIQADPTAARGSVIIDGSRPAPEDLWKPFVSKRYGVRPEHNIYYSAHDPETDLPGEDSIRLIRPRIVYKGYYPLPGKDEKGRIRARYGTAMLFQGERRLQIVPTHPKAGKMSDRRHADSEETQSEEYITATHEKFLKPGQWIWYDDGRTDGADQDDTPVSHPKELQHRIFVRLGRNEKARELSYNVRRMGIFINNSWNVTIRGLRVRRAQTGVRAERSKAIHLENLTVEEFGGGRLFRAPTDRKFTRENIWEGGLGIAFGLSSGVVSGCLVQNGTSCAINAHGSSEDDEELKILHCTVRDIAAHPWGGGWGHGKGEGMNMGNFANVLVARNQFVNCNGTAVWIDNDPDFGECRNIRIIDNLFTGCGGNAVFSELYVDRVLIAYNRIERGRSGFRIGPVSRRSRIIGNLFYRLERGGFASVYSRTGGRTDTIEYFAVAGNVFAECKQNLFWSKRAFGNPRLYVDYNVWHVPPDSKPFVVGDYDVPTTYKDMWKRIGGENFLAAGRNCRIVEQSPIAEGDAGDGGAAGLITPELLDDLVGKGVISKAERELLRNWGGAHSPKALGVQALPRGWTKRGSHLAK